MIILFKSTDDEDTIPEFIGMYDTFADAYIAWQQGGAMMLVIAEEVREAQFLTVGEVLMMASKRGLIDNEE